MLYRCIAFLRWILGLSHDARVNCQPLTDSDSAINHVITHSDDYWKPEPIRAHLGRVVGGGVLVTESKHHLENFRPDN